MAGDRRWSPMVVRDGDRRLAGGGRGKWCSEVGRQLREVVTGDGRR